MSIAKKNEKLLIIVHNFTEMQARYIISIQIESKINIEKWLTIR